MVFKKILFLILIAMVTSVFYTCDNKKNIAEGGDADSLLIKYKVLSDSVDANWEVMIADDDDKLVLMKRLLLEVSYTNNYDKNRFQELNEKVDQHKAMRYDQSSMSNSSLIDAYDNSTFALADEIFVFARNHPRFEDTPMMSELIEDINAKNNYILMHRIHYDSWVKELNSFKNNNKEKLLSSDPAIEMKQMPIFELPS